MIIADVTNQKNKLSIALVGCEKHVPLCVFAFLECGVKHTFAVTIKIMRSRFFCRLAKFIEMSSNNSSTYFNADSLNPKYFFSHRIADSSLK